MVIKFISFNSKSTIIAEVQLVLHEFQQSVSRVCAEFGHDEASQRCSQLCSYYVTDQYFVIKTVTFTDRNHLGTLSLLL